MGLFPSIVKNISQPEDQMEATEAREETLSFRQIPTFPHSLILNIKRNMLHKTAKTEAANAVLEKVHLIWSYGYQREPS